MYICVLMHRWVGNMPNIYTYDFKDPLCLIDAQRIQKSLNNSSLHTDSPSGSKVLYLVMLGTWGFGVRPQSSRPSSTTVCGSYKDFAGLQSRCSALFQGLKASWFFWIRHWCQDEWVCFWMVALAWIVCLGFTGFYISWCQTKVLSVICFWLLWLLLHLEHKEQGESLAAHF